MSENLPESAALFSEIRQLVEAARSAAATAVNVSLTMLHWRIGQRIREEILNQERADYGSQIVGRLSQQLQQAFGRGFSEKNLRRMIQFHEAFPDEAIVVSLVRQLSWTHFIALIPLRQPLQREFYAEMCRVEGWSVRVLRKKIDSMLYERTALSKQPEAVAQEKLKALREQDFLSPQLVLKDPYVLDFLDLKDRYLEKDLEDAILREIEAFLLELGGGFAFLARQKRIQIDSDDFYIDLLFYHRTLRRLVAVDLKLGDFKAEYKGQMELYLRWLNRYDRQSGEEAPLGIILCAGKKQEQIELLELDHSGIHVAEYLTVLPPREVLQQKLQMAIARAQERLNGR